MGHAMNTRRNVWISRLAILGIGFAGLSGNLALAKERQEAEISARAPAVTQPERAPTELTAEQAAAKAAEYRAKSEAFRALGGAGYKRGFVRWAEERASHFGAEAARLSAPP